MSKISLHDLYHEIKRKLQSKEIEVSNYQNISYGIQFAISQDNQSGLIRAYQNKKGQIKYDYSQTKDPLLIQIAQLGIEGHSATQGSPVKAKSDLGFPIIGTDESGKGDYFGPLVSAGVYVDENSAKLLEHEGIRDSKKLSDTQSTK